MSCAPDIAETFRQTGIVRLNGAFTPAEAATMRDAFWGYLHRHTDIRRDDPASWDTGRGSVSFKQLRRSKVFLPFHDNDSVRHALDAIFTDSGWLPPKPGSQILLTFPTPGRWMLPARGWHMDCGFDRPTWPVFAVKLFGFFDTVGEEGGGTLLLSGSHRLVDRYRLANPAEAGGNTASWGRFMTHHPALRALYKGGTATASGRDQVGKVHEIGGVPAKPIELTGQPGDVVITHLHTFHCVAPNSTDRPRLMLGKPIAAAEPTAADSVA